jgi:hypothetical protein
MNPPSLCDLRALRFPVATMFEGVEHFPEKWMPVFRRKCDQRKKLERVSDSIKSKRALEFARAWQER